MQALKTHYEVQNRAVLAVMFDSPYDKTPIDIKEDISKDKTELSILVVDDDPAICRLLTRIFTQEGYKMFAVGTGEEALKHSERTSFKFAIIDIRLPGIDGVETYKKLKKIQPEIKALLITAYAVEETVKEAIKLGAYGCLRKPFTSDEILNEFKKLLQ